MTGVAGYIPIVCVQVVDDLLFERIGVLAVDQWLDSGLNVISASEKKKNSS